MIFPDTLAFYAESLSLEVNKQLSTEEKKKKGQFFTPASIAIFMSNRIELSKYKGKTLKVLDPGSGCGILVAAIVDRIIREQLPIHLCVDLYENDRKVLPYLKKSMDQCQREMEQHGFCFEYRIISEDFILSNRYLFQQSKINPFHTYHVAVGNPPYYKINKNHEYSRILANYVYGQPNVYFMFMAVAAELIVPNGQLVFITPRSYCSGVYFERFRKNFFKYFDPDHFHLFVSRKNSFSGENVVQENVILSAFKRKTKKSRIIVSSSLTFDIQKTYRHEMFDKSIIITPADKKRVIRLPLNQQEALTIKIFDRWHNSLGRMNMKVSTGPVVPFRHSEYIEDFDPNAIPLFYMSNLKNFKVVYPAGHKDKSLSLDSLSKKIVIPSKNYVFIKRVSSKEQKRRVFAVPYVANEYPYQMFGLENHLNFIYKPDGFLNEAEIFGIAMFLNSDMVEIYFRTVNGNTQVNAYDIMSLPFPDYKFIVELGKGFSGKRMAGQDTEFIFKEMLERMNYVEFTG